jgi:Domain of unknown function (DUF1707)
MQSGARWSSPRPDYRASDAERERVALFLRDQYMEGRLDADELTERLEGAYGARTVGQLRRLVADLPLPQRPRGRPPRPRPVVRQRLAGLAIATVVAAITVVALADTLLGGVFGAILLVAYVLVVMGAWLVLAAAFALWPLLMIVAVVVFAVRRHRARARPRWDTHPLGLP